MRLLSLSTFALLTVGIGAAAVPVTVSPHVGHSATKFVVSYTLPATTGVVDSERVRDQLSAETDPARAGCQASVSVIAPAARRGQRVHVDLAPTTVSRWCTGRFKGKLVELRSPVCPPRSLCPAYIRIRTLATFTFAVR